MRLVCVVYLINSLLSTDVVYALQTDQQDMIAGFYCKLAQIAQNEGHPDSALKWATELKSKTSR